MSDAIIENPVLNSPYEEPRRHFRFGDDGITNEVIEALDPWNIETQLREAFSLAPVAR